MKIGIDLGGSHIQIGLVERGKVVQKREYNFTKEDKQGLELAIRTFLYEQMDVILESTNLGDIEMVGISVPRKTPKWQYR